MKLSRKTIKGKTSNKYRKTSKTSKIIFDVPIHLVSIALLNTNQIKQLTDIYNQYGSKTDWTEEEIIKFVIDEKIQNKKPDIQRIYYSYCIFLQDNLVGYIIGKKTHLLQKPFIGNYKPNKFDLLFAIGLDTNYRGKGIGTHAINLFINMYKQKIASLGDYAKKARLYSDIATTNISSIKVFKKNNFHYSHQIKISGKTYRRYSRLVFDI